MFTSTVRKLFKITHKGQGLEIGCSSLHFLNILPEHHGLSLLLLSWLLFLLSYNHQYYYHYVDIISITTRPGESLWKWGPHELTAHKVCYGRTAQRRGRHKTGLESGKDLANITPPPRGLFVEGHTTCQESPLLSNNYYPFKTRITISRTLVLLSRKAFSRCLEKFRTNVS